MRYSPFDLLPIQFSRRRGLVQVRGARTCPISSSRFGRLKYCKGWDQRRRQPAPKSSQRQCPGRAPWLCLQVRSCTIPHGHHSGTRVVRGQSTQRSSLIELDGARRALTNGARRALTIRLCSSSQRDIEHAAVLRSLHCATACCRPRDVTLMSVNGCY